MGDSKIGRCVMKISDNMRNCLLLVSVCIVLSFSLGLVAGAIDDTSVEGGGEEVFSVSGIILDSKGLLPQDGSDITVMLASSDGKTFSTDKLKIEKNGSVSYSLSVPSGSYHLVVVNGQGFEIVMGKVDVEGSSVTNLESPIVEGFVIGDDQFVLDRMKYRFYKVGDEDCVTLMSIGGVYSHRDVTVPAKVSYDGREYRVVCIGDVTTNGVFSYTGSSMIANYVANFYTPAKKDEAGNDYSNPGYMPKTGTVAVTNDNIGSFYGFSVSIVVEGDVTVSNYAFPLIFNSISIQGNGIDPNAPRGLEIDVTFEGSVDSVGKYAFAGIGKVTFEKEVKKVGAGAFAYSELDAFPSGIGDAIGANAFYATSLKEVRLESGVTKVNTKAFCNIEGLTDIYIGFELDKIANFHNGIINSTPEKPITIHCLTESSYKAITSNDNGTSNCWANKIKNGAVHVMDESSIRVYGNVLLDGVKVSDNISISLYSEDGVLVKTVLSQNWMYSISLEAGSYYLVVSGTDSYKSFKSNTFTITDSSCCLDVNLDREFDIALPSISFDFSSGDVVTVDEFRYRIIVEDVGNVRYYVAQLISFGTFDDRDSYVVPECIEHSGIKYHVVSIGDGSSETKIIEGLGENSSIRVTVEGFVAISDYAFSYVTTNDYGGRINHACGINGISLMNGVYSIGDFAFYGAAITEIDLEGCTSLGRSAFRESSIEVVSIPRSVTDVGANCFNGCRNLARISIDAELEEIPASFLKDTVGLTDVTLPQSCTKLNIDAFHGSGISAIDLRFVEEIGYSCFYGCTNLVSIDISNLNTIPENAFASCERLSEVLLSPGCKTIGSRAFVGSGITTIDLSGIVEIGASAFMNCSRLSAADLSSVVRIGDFAFTNSPCTVKLNGHVEVIGQYALSGTDIEAIDLGSITSIGDHAFSGCTELASAVNLPSSLPDYLFDGCSSLRDVDFEGVGSIGQYSFKGTAIEQVDLSGIAISRGSFQNCEELRKVIFDTNLSQIPHTCFSGCKELASVTWPTGSFSIGPQSFANTTSLELTGDGINMSVQDVLSSWSYEAFLGSKAISEDKGTYYDSKYLVLKLNGSVVSLMVGLSVETGIIDVSDYLKIPDNMAGVYSEIGKFPKVIVSENNAVYRSYDGVLYSADGRTLIKAPFDQEFVSILDGTETIGAKAFYQSMISEITIPSSVSVIGDYAFSKSKLSNVNIQEGLQSIGSYSFSETLLSEVVFPKSLKIIGNNAFSSTSGSVIIPEGSSLETIGDRALAMKGLTSIFIPDSLKSAGKGAFGTSIKEVYLGDSDSPIITSECFKTGDAAYASSIKVYIPIGAEPSGSYATIGGSFGGSFGGFFGFDRGLPTIMDAGLIVDGKSIFIKSSLEGIVVDKVDSADVGAGRCAVSITTEQEHTRYDLLVTIDGAVIDSTSCVIDGRTIWVYVLTLESSIFMNVEESISDRFYTVTFDTDGGDDLDPLKVGSGRTILKDQRPVPERNNSQFVMWRTESGSEYEWGLPVTSNMKLVAVWEDAPPRVIYHTDAGRINATCDGSSFVSGDRIISGMTVEFTYSSQGSIEFNGWYVRSNGVTQHYSSKTLQLSDVQNDTYITVDITYVSPSGKPTTRIDTDAPTADEDLILYWTFGGAIDMSGMAWTGHSSVPLIVDDYVYLRVSNAIYKIEIGSGIAVSTVPSINCTSYYHYLGYGHGLIFDYSNGNVYDTDLVLKKQFGTKITSVFSDDSSTYVYMLSDSGSPVLIKYSADLSTEIFRIAADRGIYGQYGTTSMPVFEGGHAYWLYSNTGSDGHRYTGVASMEVEDGTITYLPVAQVTDHLLDDGWLSYYEGRLYFTTYTQGLFGDKVVDDKGKIVSIEIADDFASSRIETYDTDYTLSSGFEIFNGRGYINVGRTFYVYDVKTMSVIYSVESSKSHGGLVVNTHNATAENNYQVTIYLIPYSPGLGLYVFTDSSGQVSGQLKKMSADTPQYNSQAVRSGPNGELIWYTDSGHIYCFGVAEKNDYFFFLDDGDKSVWIDGSGATVSDALEDAFSNYRIDGTLSSDSGMITSIWGQTGWNTLTYGCEGLGVKNLPYAWREVNLSESIASEYHYYYVTVGSQNIDRGTELYYRVGDDVSSYFFDEMVGDKTIAGKMLYRTSDVPKDNINAIENLDVVVRDNAASVTFSIDDAVIEDAVVAVYIKFSDNTYQCIFSSADQVRKIEMTGSDRPISVCIIVYDGLPDGGSETVNYGTLVRDLVSGDNHFEVAR